MQIFWNLIKNSVKFTPSGGTIKIRSRNEAEWLVFEVIDNGRGIDAEVVPNLFK